MPLFTADKRNRASLAVLFAVNILNFWDRNTLGAVAEPVRKEFGLS
ncbi:MAG: MFS transporter, partial [Acidobacteria bacterium]|nr:MFS transporter [Acidobacteriota bacterium]